MKNQIDRWIDAHARDLVRDISRLVAIRSVAGEAKEDMPFGEGPYRVLQEALTICGEYGFATGNYDNCIGTADFGGQEPALDILAHLDVVDEGDGWDTDPYTVVEKDGCLYGRGTNDNKGPLAASLLAMRCVRELGLPIRRRCRLIMGTDEESGSGDLPHYYQKEKPAPATFSPDAQFPIYNVEKGGYKPRFTKTWAADTALPRLLRFQGGYRINVVPAGAEAVVAGLSAEAVEAACRPVAEKLDVALEVRETEEGVYLSVNGRSTHAAFPESGNNGVTALLEVLCALPLAPCASTETLQQMHALFPHGDFGGNAIGIAQSDEISGALSLSLTLFSMDQTHASGQFDSRVPICANADNCARVVEQRLGACGFQVEGEMGKAHHTPADSPFIGTLLRCYEEWTGQKGACLAMGGGTYVHDIEGGVAFGAGMPGFVSFAHSANERADLANLLTAAKIFASVIVEMCR